MFCGVALIVVLVNLCIYFVAGERVSIQAGKSFCVFEDLKANIPWGIQFQSDEHEIKCVVQFPFYKTVFSLFIFIFIFLDSQSCKSFTQWKPGDLRFLFD